MTPEDREALIGSMLTTPTERPVTQHMVVVDLPDGLTIPPGGQLLTRRFLDSGNLEADVRTSPGGTWDPVQIVSDGASLRFEEA